MPHYEDISRIADPRMQNVVREVMGFGPDVMNNVDPVPEPGDRVGAGRPAAFLAAPNTNIAQQGADPATQTNLQSEPTMTANGNLVPNDIHPTSGIEMTRNRGRVAGYAGLAEFMASDRSFCVFRRFDRLSIRNLLFLQDEIIELEQQLLALDRADFESGDQARLYWLHSRRKDGNEERKAVGATLSEKLYRYQKRLLLHSQCLRMEKARDLYVESVENWVDGKKPVSQEESLFLDEKNDLASLGLKVEDYHVFEKWVEQHFSLPFVSKKHQNRPLFGEEIRYFSSTTIRRVVRGALTFICVVVLVGPLFALTYTKNQEYRLALIACFSLIFALAIALATKSRNFEIFVAVAAYAAVLVVFVGNNNSGDSSSS